MRTATRTHRRIAAALSMFLAASGALAGKEPQIGDQAPELLGRNLENKPIALATYRGKVVVVSFWASWCPYCLKEIPVLESLQRAGKGALQVIAVNWKEDRAIIRNLHKKVPDLQLMTTSDVDGRAGARYAVSGIPHLLIIGKDGRIAYLASGYDESMLDSIVTAINTELAKPLAPPAPTPIGATT